MLSGDEEIFREFLVESAENLDQLDRDFVALESNPGDSVRVGAIFRAIHTIKGTSGFLGLPKLEGLAHAGENVLSRIRDGNLALTPATISTLLSTVDGIRRILKSVETTSAEGTEDFGDLIARLEVYRRQEATPLGQILVSTGDAVLDALQTQNEERSAAVSDTTIRVDVGLLDKLMNLVGELVLARNQILQVAGQSKDAAFLSTSQRLNLLTTELQEGVMKTRMQPIGNVWNKFPRVVRDLAMACGKQVELEMIGEATDLDRTIIEAIKDPLTHIVRNSVDHGIETPAARVERGKGPTGKLVLRAFHEGGQVNIEISDDGNGVDPEKIKQKAIAKGLLTPERAAGLSARESLHLIFLPGFSTAEKVTSVSGRGVGMDVVKTNVEKIGGTVDVQSTVGQGTTLKIKIPLTLAIIPALVVTSYTSRFAIPQVNLLELVRLEGDQARAGVEHIHGTPVYRLRGNILPLVYLNRTLGLPETPLVEPMVVNIVVLQADDRQFGLVVDGVTDTEEIVVKPLGKELKGLNVFAGATIMGDGRVALILDVLGIAERTNVISAVRDRPLAEAAREVAARKEKKRAVLLFRVAEEGRSAIPLSMVARLEEFSREELERSGGRHVVQYRGRILPLIDLCGVLQSPEKEGPLQVVVYSEQGRSVGLIVDRIVDIVEEAIGDEPQEGGELSAVIAGRVTDLLDVDDVIRAHDPQFFERTTNAA